jgi:hypothetical protein
VLHDDVLGSDVVSEQRIFVPMYAAFRFATMGLETLALQCFQDKLGCDNTVTALCFEKSLHVKEISSPGRGECNN